MVLEKLTTIIWFTCLFSFIRLFLVFQVIRILIKNDLRCGLGANCNHRLTMLLRNAWFWMDRSSFLFMAGKDLTSYRRRALNPGTWILRAHAMFRQPLNMHEGNFKNASGDITTVNGITDCTDPALTRESDDEVSFLSLINVCTNFSFVLFFFMSVKWRREGRMRWAEWGSEDRHRCIAFWLPLLHFLFKSWRCPEDFRDTGGSTCKVCWCLSAVCNWHRSISLCGVIASRNRQEWASCGSSRPCSVSKVSFCLSFTDDDPFIFLLGGKFLFPGSSLGCWEKGCNVNDVASKRIGTTGQRSGSPPKEVRRRVALYDLQTSCSG